MIYIIGHIQPDLDSAVAAVALNRLYKAIDGFGYKNTQAVLASPANYETKTIFAKFNQPLAPVLSAGQIKPEDRFILVDHNEPSQRLQNISNDQIIDIVDHHKAAVDFPLPIFITTKPWGSSATVIYWLMKITGYQPDQNLAGLMVGAILSDTVGLKSATTTPKDKNVLDELNQIAKTNLKELTVDIFKAKSDLSGLTTKQILTKDYKIFDFSGQKVLINQVETIEQEKITAQADLYLNEMAVLKQAMGLNKIYFIVTDVLKINSQCLTVTADTDTLVSAFPRAKKLKNGVYDLGKVMSRKKEIAPAIEKAVAASH